MTDTAPEKLMLTAEEARAVEQYAGRDWNHQREIEETPLSEYSDERWPLGEFIEILTAIYDDIPEDRRHTAFVDFETGYESNGHLTVTYSRLESDDEAINRIAGYIAHVRVAAEQRAARERAEYERLKAKFEAP